MLNNKYNSFFDKNLCECNNKCEKESDNTKKDIENETQKIQNSLHRYLRHLIMFENNNVSEQTMIKEKDRFHTEAFSNIWYLLENIKKINKALEDIILETKTDDQLFDFLNEMDKKEVDKNVNVNDIESVNNFDDIKIEDISKENSENKKNQDIDNYLNMFVEVKFGGSL